MADTREKKTEDIETKNLEKDVKTIYGSIFDPRVVRDAFKHKEMSSGASSVETALDDIGEMNVELSQMTPQQKVRFEEEWGFLDDTEDVFKKIDAERASVVDLEKADREAFARFIGSEEVPTEGEMSIDLIRSFLTGARDADELSGKLDDYELVDLFSERVEDLDQQLQDMGLDGVGDLEINNEEDFRRLEETARSQMRSAGTKTNLDKMTDED